MANKILKTLTLPNAQGEPITYELHPEWDNIEGKPEAYPADWNNISNKPDSFVTNWNDIPDKPETYPTDWDSIENKPENFGVGEFHKVDNEVKGEIFNDYNNNIASGKHSHAEGQGTVASSECTHVEGRFNAIEGNYAHVVGNGSDNMTRSNAHTLDWDGNAWFAGDIYVGGTSQDDAAVKVCTELDLDVYAAEESVNTSTEVINADTLQGYNANSFRRSDWMPTASDVGAATAGHTHSIGMNPIASTSEDTVANWVAKGNGFAYFNKFVLNNQPTQRGFLVNKVQDSTIHQEWHTIEQHSRVYVRAGQGSAWVGGSVWEHGQTDYVTATGTSGVWSYWKFSSGLCIAMGQPTVTWGTQTQMISGQYRSTASLDLTGIFTAVMGGTCSNVHRYVNCFVAPSGGTTAELWATTAATAGNSLYSTTPMVVLFGKWK